MKKEKKKQELKKKFTKNEIIIFVTIGVFSLILAYVLTEHFGLFVPYDTIPPEDANCETFREVPFSVDQKNVANYVAGKQNIVSIIVDSSGNNLHTYMREGLADCPQTQKYFKNLNKGKERVNG